MKLVVEFDINADIIDVPEIIIVNKEKYKKEFLRWLYQKKNLKKYTVTEVDGSGHVFCGIRYRSDAFVEWLNTKVLKEESRKAKILIENTTEYNNSAPKIFF